MKVYGIGFQVSGEYQRDFQFSLKEVELIYEPFYNEMMDNHEFYNKRPIFFYKPEGDLTKFNYDLDANFGEDEKLSKF